MVARAVELTNVQVLAIFYAKGTHIAIGLEHGVSPSCVGSIKLGKTHRSITKAPVPGPKRAAITTLIRKAIVEGTDPYRARAARLGISQATVVKYMKLHKAANPDYKDPVHVSLRDAKGSFIKKNNKESSHE